MKVELGQRVAFDHELRRFKSAPHTSGPFAFDRTWDRRKVPTITGFVVGVRTLQNGTTIFYGDEPPVWRRSGSVPAIVVAVNLFRKPVFVHPDDIRDPDLVDLPTGLCGNREDHEPHLVQGAAVGDFWCGADQSTRLPYSRERELNDRAE